MSAFKAFKCCVPVEWSDKLYITLVRGMPGTRELHSRTLEALRLLKCNRTKNTSTVRGMIQLVKRLVAIETKEMYEAQKQTEAITQLCDHHLFLVIIRPQQLILLSNFRDLHSA